MIPHTCSLSLSLSLTPHTHTQTECDSVPVTPVQCQRCGIWLQPVCCRTGGSSPEGAGWGRKAGWGGWGEGRGCAGFPPPLPPHLWTSAPPVASVHGKTWPVTHKDAWNSVSLSLLHFLGHLSFFLSVFFVFFSCLEVTVPVCWVYESYTNLACWPHFTSMVRSKDYHPWKQGGKAGGQEGSRIWLLACLTSQQHVSVSQGQICSYNCMCCYTEIEAADRTFHLTQSVYWHQANQSHHWSYNARCLAG